MGRAQGARAVMALAFESVFGTPPVSGFFQMPFASTTLGGKSGLLPGDLLGYGRDPQAPQKDLIDVSGDIVVPVDAVAFGYWLKALLGAPTTTGAGPYTHTFTSGGASLPSLSIEKQMPEASSYAMMKGLMANSMTMTLQRGGLLTASIGLMGMGEDSATTSQAGSLAAIELRRFGQYQATIDRDGSPLGNVPSLELNFSNNMEAADTAGNGGMLAGIDPGMTSLTGKATTRFADTVLLTQAVDGTSCELEVGFVNGADSLTMTLHEVYLSRPAREITGPQGIQCSFDLMGAKASSPARMMTAVLVNDIASYA